ncbi:baseplate assembly protein [Pectobacterium colocasium]|uniref:baseplate assembly protein n=1 Tax=Pectobacterium colocasium TaxID=2878098 RepID=UPI003305D1E4
MSGLIDLSLLPAPDVVETLDYETLYAERKAMFIALFPVEQRDAITRTLALESEPLTKLLQLSVYHELLLRQRINEAASANMLAYAAGSDLDQLAANVNVQRLVITAEDTTAIPPVAAVMESDADLRTRTQQAFEGLSVAGPTAAYEFHARSADGRVADASAVSPSPAAVTVTVLSREGDGSACNEVLQAVDTALNAENVRPVADRVTVQSAVIIPYGINATLYFYPGPEAEPIRIAAEARLQTYITAQHRLGRDIRRSAIFAALHVEGVQRVDLESPAADIVLDKSQASYCANWVLNIGGSDE